MNATMTYIVSDGRTHELYTFTSSAVFYDFFIAAAMRGDDLILRAVGRDYVSFYMKPYEEQEGK